MELSINVFLLAGIFASGALIGFFLRRSNIAAHNKKVAELEKEMLNSHAEILQLQREKIELLRKMESPSIPVIPIKANKDEKASETVADVTTRKKLLGHKS